MFDLKESFEQLNPAQQAAVEKFVQTFLEEKKRERPLAQNSASLHLASVLKKLKPIKPPRKKPHGPRFVA